MFFYFFYFYSFSHSACAFVCAPSVLRLGFVSTFRLFIYEDIFDEYERRPVQCSVWVLFGGCEADACVRFLKFMSSHNANAFSFVNRTGRQTTRLFGMRDATTNDQTHNESHEKEEEEVGHKRCVRCCAKKCTIVFLGMS